MIFTITDNIIISDDYMGMTLIILLLLGGYMDRALGGTFISISIIITAVSNIVIDGGCMNSLFFIITIGGYVTFSETFITRYYIMIIFFIIVIIFTIADNIIILCGYMDMILIILLGEIFISITIIIISIISISIIVTAVNNIVIGGYMNSLFFIITISGDGIFGETFIIMIIIIIFTIADNIIIIPGGYVGIDIITIIDVGYAAMILIIIDGGSCYTDRTF